MSRQALCQKGKLFFESRWYAVAVAVLMLLAHCTFYVGGKPLFGGYQAYVFGGLMGISLCVACFLCTDARFFIMPFISIVFIITREHSPGIPSFSGFLLEPWNFAVICVFVASVFGCLVWFVIKNYRYANVVDWKSPVFWGLVIFAVTLSCNGFFSEYYSFSNTLFACLFSAVMILVYLFFAAYVRFDRSAMEHVFTCILALGLLLGGQILWGYLAGCVRFDDMGNVIKETVVTGWGIWTAVGGMLVFTLPASLYFAHSHRHPWIYWLLAILELVCIFLTQSRGALLFGLMAFALSVLVLCVSGKNRRFNRIFTAALFAVGALGVLLIFNKLQGILQNYLTYGFSDNGRYEKWLAGWNNFLSNPIFGAGFYGSFSYVEFEKGPYPYFYHNTFIQMLGTGGVVAMGGYLWHRFTTLRLAFCKPNPEKTFLGLCALSFLAFSLLDVLFFNTYPNVLYAIILLYMEKSDCVKELWD